MCGRYRLSRRKQLVEEYFDSSGEEDWVSRYNVAPIQPVPIIRQNPKEPLRNAKATMLLASAANSGSSLCDFATEQFYWKRVMRVWGRLGVNSATEVEIYEGSRCCSE